MKLLLLAALPLTVLLPAAADLPIASHDEPSGVVADEPDPLHDLASLEGTWVAGGKWENGNDFYTRNVFEWGLGKRILQVHTFAGTPENESLLFETTFVWHPGHQRIRMTTYAYFGAVYEGFVDVTDAGELELIYDGHLPGKKTPRKHSQRYRLDGDNAYDWWSFDVDDDGKKLLVKTRFERVK